MQQKPQKYIRKKKTLQNSIVHLHSVLCTPDRKEEWQFSLHPPSRQPKTGACIHRIDKVYDWN